jgi:hypothetical protein
MLVEHLEEDVSAADPLSLDGTPHRKKSAVLAPSDTGE